MKKLLSLITICMITTLCISINSSAATFGDNLTYDKVSNAEIATKTNRFFQEGTIHITNKQEIKEYQESMGLKYDPDDSLWIVRSFSNHGFKFFHIFS